MLVQGLLQGAASFPKSRYTWPQIFFVNWHNCSSRYCSACCSSFLTPLHRTPYHASGPPSPRKHSADHDAGEETLQLHQPGRHTTGQRATDSVCVVKSRRFSEVGVSPLRLYHARGCTSKYAGAPFFPARDASFPSKATTGWFFMSVSTLRIVSGSSTVCKMNFCIITSRAAFSGIRPRPWLRASTQFSLSATPAYPMYICQFQSVPFRLIPSRKLVYVQPTL